MRLRYPDKAVICSVSGADPWLTLAAGGSLVALPPTTEPALLKELISYQTVAIDDAKSPVLGALKGASGQGLELRSTPAQPDAIAIDRKSGRRTIDTKQSEAPNEPSHLLVA